MDNNKNLEGLGGWLIFVGIGIVTSPIWLLAATIPVILPIFVKGRWGALTTSTSEFYNPSLASLIAGEIVFNVFMLTASICLIYLFFSKHYLFPKVYIIIAIVSLLFFPIDAWIASLLVPEQPAFNSEFIKEFARLLIGAAVWVPYLLKSKRVRATFVNKVPSKQFHSTLKGAG